MPACCRFALPGLLSAHAVLPPPPCSGLVLEPLPVGAWAFLSVTTAIATKTLPFAAVRRCPCFHRLALPPVLALGGWVAAGLLRSMHVTHRSFF